MCVAHGSGIYQSNLFRTLPNRNRLLELISIFDSRERPPGIKCSTPRPDQTTFGGFGADVSLQLESTADICALFTSYLSALPDPLVPAYLFDTIWVLCDLETSPSLTKDLSCDTNTSRFTLTILLSQLLLHLLPHSNFSLLIYILGFFSQVVLVNEENGVDIRDLAKMFGARLFGNGLAPPAASSPTTTSSSSTTRKSKLKDPDSSVVTRGEIMMAWFLRRWASIFDSLFDVVEDAKMGVYRRSQRLRKDSLGRPALQRRRDNATKVQTTELGNELGALPKPQTTALSRSRTTTKPVSPRTSLDAYRFPPLGSPLMPESSVLKRLDEEDSPTTVRTPAGRLQTKPRKESDNDVLGGFVGHSMVQPPGFETMPIAATRSKSETNGLTNHKTYYATSKGYGLGIGNPSGMCSIEQLQICQLISSFQITLSRHSCQLIFQPSVETSKDVHLVGCRCPSNKFLLWKVPMKGHDFRQAARICSMKLQRLVQEACKARRLY